MKLRRVGVTNVRGFLAESELVLDGDISILVGPNGAGKTTLLDLVVTGIRRHLLRTWVVTNVSGPAYQHELRISEIHDPLAMGRHYRAPKADQRVEFDFEVTVRDIENITSMRDSIGELQEKSSSTHETSSLNRLVQWNPDVLRPGMKLTYSIANDVLLNPSDTPPRALFFEYLRAVEGFNLLRREVDAVPLSVPMVSLPNTRMMGGATAAVSLANLQDHELRGGVESATSRQPGSVFSLAIGHLASRMRTLREGNNVAADDVFYADRGTAALTRQLARLGFTWKLVCTDLRSNQYSVQLKRDGAEFFLDAASSGEKELLGYLLLVFALDLRDSLVVVDEPELHLHPQWQREVFEVFADLARQTGNQFLLSTHSPAFIAPNTIQYVSRVYSHGRGSQVVRLRAEGLPENKHLFSIVNSHNNEKILFSEFVILVEGLSDRLVFERVLKRFSPPEVARRWEIVSVGGKGLFSKYEEILQACRVPYCLISDLDYVKEIGGPAEKALFRSDGRKIKDDVVDSIKSKDGEALCAQIEDVLAGGDREALNALWTYIRESRLKLLDLSAGQKSSLEAFIADLRKRGTFVLTRGALEAYLPPGLRSKDLEKLIRFVEDDDFWDRLEISAKSELEGIAREIVSRIALRGQPSELPS
jgi:energy-coupling factor transporter ATP-binding protein EcfA2